jgi:uncharacterized protein YndB with AHSA1/START domain
MPAGPSFKLVVDIATAPGRVLQAFSDGDAIEHWWGARRAIVVPRPLGVFAVAWPEGPSDEILGPLGGVLHGVVIDVRSARELFVADAYWQPPAGDPLGPLSIRIACAVAPSGTTLDIEVAGEGDGPRWHRWFDVLRRDLPPAIDELTRWLEGEVSDRRA